MTENESIHRILVPGEERDTPIEVYFGSPALDLGIATIPKILPRFWTYLTSDDGRLNDRQYALLMQVLLLRNSRDYELRVENLPMASSEITLERDKKVLRRMGLVFTQRIYYPAQPGKPPRMQAQRWDMRSLFFNLEQIAQTWIGRQNDLVARREEGGRNERTPVYHFPGSFTHEVTLPLEVALDIVKGVFYPVPDKWIARARTVLDQLPTGLEWAGRLPTGRDKFGTATEPEKSGTTPTGLYKAGHLLTDDDEEEEDSTALVDRIFAYFANCKGDLHYSPTDNEQRALEKLLIAGFTYEQIIAGIDRAFTRPTRPRYFTHCAAITRDFACLQHESRSPEARTQPETRQPEAIPGSEEEKRDIPASEPGHGIKSADTIEPGLSRAVTVYSSAGREVNTDVLTRFRLMIARCEAAARLSGSTGGDWLADGLTTALGVARPENLLHYADAVLTDWIANGRKEPHSKPSSRKKVSRRSSPGSPKEPAAHEGIREYLKQHGGSPNGYAG